MKITKKIYRKIQYMFVKKGWANRNRHYWLVNMCYTDMFKAAGGDFEELKKNAPLNERGEKEIPFMDYEITQKEFNSILKFYQSFLKEDYYKRALSTQIHLGCSPKTKQ